MSATLERPPTTLSENLAELVERLGGIPLERIRMSPPPGTATEDDVLRSERMAEKRLCELIDGVLVEKPMAFRESMLAAYLIRIMGNFIAQYNSGIVTAPDGFVRLFVGRVRSPDVSFTSWNRLPGRKVPSQPIPTLAPDLVVEVLSPSNTEAEMKSKRREFFGVGTRLFWIADPETRTVRVYTDVDDVVTLAESEILDGGDVLPGFSLPLRDWFAELDRQG